MAIADNFNRLMSNTKLTVLGLLSSVAISNKVLAQNAPNNHQGASQTIKAKVFETLEYDGNNNFSAVSIEKDGQSYHFKKTGEDYYFTQTNLSTLVISKAQTHLTISEVAGRLNGLKTGTTVQYGMQHGEEYSQVPKVQFDSEYNKTVNAATQPVVSQDIDKLFEDEKKQKQQNDADVAALLNSKQAKTGNAQNYAPPAQNHSKGDKYAEEIKKQQENERAVLELTKSEQQQAEDSQNTPPHVNKHHANTGPALSKTQYADLADMLTTIYRGNDLVYINKVAEAAFNRELNKAGISFISAHEMADIASQYIHKEGNIDNYGFSAAIDNLLKGQQKSVKDNISEAEVSGFIKGTYDQIKNDDSVGPAVYLQQTLKEKFGITISIQEGLDLTTELKKLHTSNIDRVTEIKLIGDFFNAKASGNSKGRY